MGSQDFHISLDNKSKSFQTKHLHTNKPGQAHNIIEHNLRHPAAAAGVAACSMLLVHCVCMCTNQLID